MLNFPSKNILELPFTFDVERLQSDLDCVKSSDWVKHPNVNAYNGSWLISSLTSISGSTRQIMAVENQDYFDTPLLKETTYIKSVIDTFKTKVEAVRFMNLSANSVIKEHTDKGSCFEDGLVRIHIPINTNKDVKFLLNGIITKMDIGKCYYIDANAPHSVVNSGNSQRVHLLIDCQVNDWIKYIFKQSGFIETIYKYDNKFIHDGNIDDIILSLNQMNTPVSLEIVKKLKYKKNNYIQKEKV